MWIFCSLGTDGLIESGEKWIQQPRPASAESLNNRAPTVKHSAH